MVDYAFLDVSDSACTQSIVVTLKDGFAGILLTALFPLGNEGLLAGKSEISISSQVVNKDEWGSIFNIRLVFQI